MAYNPPAGGIAKVLVVGDVATGKTSVIKRYVRNTFSKDYQTTIGVDFALKRVNTNGTDMNVQLWDIAGQERFSGLSRIFYTHAVAAIIVYDLFQRDSFESAAKWKKDIDSKVFLPSGAKIPVLLLGNKDDLASEQQNPEVSDEEIEKFVKEHGFFAHFKCSAKTGHNIKQACNHLVMQIAENNKTEKAKEEENEKDAQEEKEQGAVSLGADASKPQQQSSGGCCG
jgi:Ras-related protein Rab-32